MAIKLDVPIDRPRARRARQAPDDGTPEVSVEFWRDCCRVWDTVNHTDCGETYRYDRDPTRRRLFGDRPLTEMPYFAEVFKAVVGACSSNRGNPLGRFLEVAANAMEVQLAAKDGSQVYFAEAGGRIKIGWSRRVASRIADLQTGSAAPIRLLGMVPGARRIERQIHGMFSHLRVGGEWFEASPDLLAYVAAQSGQTSPARTS